jgi:hypothetical protein
MNSSQVQKATAARDRTAERPLRVLGVREIRKVRGGVSVQTGMRAGSVTQKGRG